MLWERGKAYGQDLRERVFAASDDGVPVGSLGGRGGGGGVVLALSAALRVKWERRCEERGEQY